MVNVITGPTEIKCSHGGKGTIVSRQLPPLLTIGEMPALVVPDAIGVTIDCPLKPPLKPCTTITAVSAGIATKLQVQGKPALLANASGSTDNGTWNVVPAGPTKLDAI